MERAKKMNLNLRILYQTVSNVNLSEMVELVCRLEFLNGSVYRAYYNYLITKKLIRLSEALNVNFSNFGFEIRKWFIKKVSEML